MNDLSVTISPAPVHRAEPAKSHKTKAQKAADRTQQRRVIRQQLQHDLRQILANYRTAIRAARDEIRWLRDIMSQTAPDLDDWGLTEEPAAPSRHRGQAPSPRQIAEFLRLHAEWESLSGRARERLLREHKNWLESTAQRDALEAVDAALGQALAQATGKPALQHELRLMALEAHLKVRGRSRMEAPALISQLYDQVSIRRLPDKTFAEATSSPAPILTEIDEDVLFPAMMGGSVRIHGVWRTTQNVSAWAYAHEK